MLPSSLATIKIIVSSDIISFLDVNNSNCKVVGNSNWHSNK